ncbi:MAG TPA: peptide-methionine (R)-S-oxide reductase MsrB [Patescibacteria group bacterium]|nr:peptide-methionine (R)-S-oxide reductase MsrB [Patescibacteria group bacterium]
MDTQLLPQTDDEWRDRLTPEQFAVLRDKNTEAPFTGRYVHETTSGKYACAACGNELFDSTTKFDSNSGWPSFYDAMPGAVTLASDNSHGMQRTEIICGRCGSHLGHLFDDAFNQPTGKRYCINSISLNLKKN